MLLSVPELAVAFGNAAHTQDEAFLFQCQQEKGEAEAGLVITRLLAHLAIVSPPKMTGQRIAKAGFPDKGTSPALDQPAFPSRGLRTGAG